MTYDNDIVSTRACARHAANTEGRGGGWENLRAPLIHTVLRDRPNLLYGRGGWWVVKYYTGYVAGHSRDLSDQASGVDNIVNNGVSKFNVSLARYIARRVGTNDPVYHSAKHLSCRQFMRYPTVNLPVYYYYTGYETIKTG